jgi:hypothetical protein
VPTSQSRRHEPRCRALAIGALLLAGLPAQQRRPCAGTLLDVRPSRVRSDVAELRTLGGDAGLPAGLLISAVDGVPLPAPLLINLIGVLSPRPARAVDLPVPVACVPDASRFIACR